MKYLMKFLGVSLLAAIALASPVLAQNVVQAPVFVAPRTVVDLGNGPFEVKALSGNGALFTQSNSGTSTTVSASTSVTMNPVTGAMPCVGCVITGTGLPAASSVTVTATTGTTSITLSTVATIVTGTTLSWGTACPTSSQTAPVQPPASNLMAFLQPGQPPGTDLPIYTQARVCGYGGTGPGIQFLTFAIGGH